MIRIVVNVLAVIGAISLIAIGAVAAAALFFSSNPELHTENLTRSPDGLYKAVTFTHMGGGAAGFCNEIVAVVPANEEFQRTSDEFQVFTGSCGTKPKAKWISPSILRIEFSGLRDSSGISTYFRGKDSTGNVSIAYGVGA